MKRSNRRRARKQDQQRKLRMELLEHRLCLAASLGWDGPGLGAASLSYHIGNVPAGVGLEQAEVETAIESALDAWAQVADLTFTQTPLARQSDSLDITFTSIDGHYHSVTALDVLSVIKDEETEEESDDELDDETMVDEGPLDEEHEGCYGGRRDPFARFDDNEDDLLTVDEVPEMLWPRFLAADADENGAISPAELEAIAREHHRRDRFAEFDTNEDGALTVDEVPERLWDRLSQADADEDGAVTAEELAEARSELNDRFSHRDRSHRNHHRHERR